MPLLQVLLLLTVPGLAMAGAAIVDEIELRAGTQVLRISAASGLPLAWTVCDTACDRAASRHMVLLEPGSGGLRWLAADAAAADAVNSLKYTAGVNESAQGITAVLTAQSGGAHPIVQRYEVSRDTHGIRARLTVPPGVVLHFATGAGFVPEQLPGFGGAFADVEVVRVSGDGQQVMSGEVTETTVQADEWLGIRSHYWTWLAKPPAAAQVLLAMPEANRPEVKWRLPPGTHDLSVYAGPVEWHSLRAIAPDLTQMLFAALWEPLRWLCCGLFFLLTWITSWVASPGLAIILLSLAAKIILWPLTSVADRWQAEVNHIQSRLQPRLDTIRQDFKGEEAHNRTLAVYKEEGVHPLYTVKSLGGFAIQVPMFIAAFDMLADNFALSGASFLWIEDLAKPDRWLALPTVLPFFGGHLNLLPCLMTGFTVLAAVLQADPSLSPDLARRQRLRLFGMAGAFFLLFYTFPAGMVLYWTANNVWHLVKIQLLRVLATP